MSINYHKRFLKNFKKRILPNPKLDKQFEERLNLFLEAPDDPILKDHPLKGSLDGFRAFSITGDIRLVYRIEADGIQLFDIGTHNQVY